MDAAKIYSLFEERRAQLGLTQAEVGRLAFGKADNAPLQNIKKGSSPSIARVAAIATALGLEFRLGVPVEIAMRPNVKAEIEQTRAAMALLKAAIQTLPVTPMAAPKTPAPPKSKKEKA